MYDLIHHLLVQKKFVFIKLNLTFNFLLSVTIGIITVSIVSDNFFLNPLQKYFLFLIIPYINNLSLLNLHDFLYQ